MSIKHTYRAISRRDRAISNSLMALDHFLGAGLVDRLLGGVRERMHQRVIADLVKAGKGRAVPIERRPGLTQEEFYERYFRPGIPVLIEGAAREWACATKWSPRFFAETYGDDPVEILGERYPHEKDVAPQALTLREHIENFERGELTYLTFYPIFAKHPELVLDFDFEWLEKWRSESTLYYHCQFFMGPQNTETGVHNAQWCNLFVQAYGEKRWHIFPPGYAPIMDPPALRSIYRPSFLNHPGHYQTKANAPDYLNYYEAFTKPGDVLWNPPFWWHRVNNITHSIGVGCRWSNNRLAFQESPTMYLLDLFATNPSFFRMFVQGRREAREMQRGFDTVTAPQP